MHLEILSPENKIFEGEVNSVIFPGSNGKFQILNNHAPLIDMDLSCLENCIDKDNPKQYTDIDARGFLEERLKEIGLKSK